MQNLDEKKSAPVILTYQRYTPIEHQKYWVTRDQPFSSQKKGPGNEVADTPAATMAGENPTESTYEGVFLYDNE